MGWLGVDFEPCLLFSEYATKMASKDQKAAASLSILVKTTRRVKAVVIHKVVHACILPIFTYRIPA